MCVHAHLCSSGGQRTILQELFTLLFFETAPLIGLELTKQARLASWPVSSRNAPVSTSPVLRLQASVTTPSL